MDNPAETVKGRQSWGRRVLEIGEDIVLDDRQPRPVCNPQQSVADDRREDPACRIVKGGIGNVEAWPVFG